MRLLLPLHVVSLLWCLAVPALADPVQGKHAFLEGERLYQLGRFDEAISAYERAYALDARPAFLFNIALSHRRQFELDGKRDHLLRARELYNNLLRQETRARERTSLENRVAELTRKLDALQEPARSATPAPPLAEPPTPARTAAGPPAPPAPPPAVTHDRVALTVTPTTTARTTRRPRTRWIVLGTVAGVVVVGAAIGIAVGIARAQPDTVGPTLDLTPRSP